MSPKWTTAFLMGLLLLAALSAVSAKSGMGRGLYGRHRPSRLPFRRHEPKNEEGDSNLKSDDDKDSNEEEDPGLTLSLSTSHLEHGRLEHRRLEHSRHEVNNEEGDSNSKIDDDDSDSEEKEDSGVTLSLSTGHLEHGRLEHGRLEHRRLEHSHHELSNEEGDSNSKSDDDDSEEKEDSGVTLSLSTGHLGHGRLGHGRLGHSRLGHGRLEHGRLEHSHHELNNKEGDIDPKSDDDDDDSEEKEDLGLTLSLSTGHLGHGHLEHSRLELNKEEGDRNLKSDDDEDDSDEEEDPGVTLSLSTGRHGDDRLEVSRVEHSHFEHRRLELNNEEGNINPKRDNDDDSDEEEDPGVVEMVFSFDTTGSMYPVLTKVRQVVSDMIGRLQSDIPGIRIAVFAHGDWQDAKQNYASTWIDFTTDIDRLQNFVTGVEQTRGGDLPEAYELVLYQASRELSWTHGSRRSLVMIGDNIPHEANYYANVLNVSWRDEADLLKSMGVRIYAIHALDYNAEAFYRTIARKTDGVYLRLDNFNSIIKFIMAISYREHGLEYLEAYERELRKQGVMTIELENLFRNLRQNPVRRSTRNQIDPTRSPSATTTPKPTTPLPTEAVAVTSTGPEVYQLHIESDISYRFATTIITSKLENKLNVSSEAFFNVVLPKAAFISNFTMIIDGISYTGEVKEKEAAKKKYEAAKEKGESAGHIAAAPRNTNKFKVSVNVASLSKVTFVLLYQEMLGRRLGVYNHVIHVDPEKIIPDLEIIVNIHESRDLTYLHVPERRGERLNVIGAHMDNPYAIITRPSTNKARIAYRPTPEQQKNRAAAGLAGKFVVEYDVVRTKDAGEVQIVDGYFVHYVAPDGLPPSNKNIMFVLDTSGSMLYRKLNQVKKAMQAILKELRPGDSFNLIQFSDFVRLWQEGGMVPATESYKKAAIAWIQTRFASGGTNINHSLQRAMEMLANHSQSNNMTSVPTASLIIFLTDGQPTSGVTNTGTIISNIRELNQQRFTLFSLGFGEGVNFQFLTKLSLQNNGFARKIYADADADLQLQGFYTEVGTPTLSQVRVTYLDNAVAAGSLTKTQYANYFDGGEIIITGRLSQPDTAILKAQVNANSLNGPWSHEITSLAVDGDDKKTSILDEEDDSAPSAAGLHNTVERMWAYLTIKGLLKQMIETTSNEEKAELKEKALNVSLQYNFVTPLTSMVVVKPDESDDVEDVDDPDAPKDDAAPTSSPINRYRPSLPSGSSDSRVSHSRRHPGTGSSFADSDPHFIVSIKGSTTPICFDVMGTPGEVFNLVYDPKADLVVNGLIVGKKTNALEEKPKTYFGKIALHYGSKSFVFTPLKIRIGKTDMQWKVNTTIVDGNFSFTLHRKNMVKVSIGDTIDFIIMRHLVRPDHPVKVSFLGFYIDKDQGLSEDAHGLLGQFKQLIVGIDKDIDEVKPKSKATMSFNSQYSPRQEVEVTAGHRENMANKEVVPCWFVHNNGRYLLDGRHLDYLVPYVSYKKPPPQLIKKGIIDFGER